MVDEFVSPGLPSSQHPPSFHNGIAATLDDVVQLYNTKKGLGLTSAQSAGLVEYLKSL